MKELKLGIDSITVACPRCQSTTLPLRSARRDARKASGNIEVKNCLSSDCFAGPLLWGNAAAEEDSVETDEDSDDTEQDSTATAFDVAGFALWLAKLPSATLRARAVNDAFERAAATGPSSEFMYDHAWSLLTTYVAVGTLPTVRAGVESTVTVPLPCTLYRCSVVSQTFTHRTARCQVLAHIHGRHFDSAGACPRRLEGVSQFGCGW